MMTLRFQKKYLKKYWLPKITGKTNMFFSSHSIRRGNQGYGVLSVRVLQPGILSLISNNTKGGK